MKTPKKKLAIISSLSVLIVGIGMWLFMPKNGLLDRAILVASGQEWVKPTDQSALVPVYEWLNERELLIFKRTDGDKITLFRQQVIPAGIKSPATLMPVSPFSSHSNLEISPNKKTLKLTDDHSSFMLARRNPYKFVSLEDGHTIKKITGSYSGIWKEEDSSFWKFNYKDGLSAEIEHYDTGKNESRSLKMFSKSIKEEISHESYDPSGRVIAFGKSYDSQMVLFPEQTVYDFNINHLETPPRKISFNFPRNMTLFDSDISISGNKIFWEVCPVPDYITTYILSRLPPPWTPRITIRWIVSDLHGENMHSIAEYQYEGTDNSPLDMGDPKLSPDGKYVSFIHNQGLYLLPTN